MIDRSLRQHRLCISGDSQSTPSGGGHGCSPVLVNAGEPFALRGQLLVDVLRVEDRLQVQPVTLHG